MRWEKKKKKKNMEEKCVCVKPRSQWKCFFLLYLCVPERSNAHALFGMEFFPCKKNTSKKKKRTGTTALTANTLERDGSFSFFSFFTELLSFFFFFVNLQKKKKKKITQRTLDPLWMCVSSYLNPLVNSSQRQIKNQPPSSPLWIEHFIFFFFIFLVFCSSSHKKKKEKEKEKKKK